MKITTTEVVVGGALLIGGLYLYESNQAQSGTDSGSQPWYSGLTSSLSSVVSGVQTDFLVVAGLAALALVAYVVIETKK
jgi:hypothetical protein